MTVIQEFSLGLIVSLFIGVVIWFGNDPKRIFIKELSFHQVHGTDEDYIDEFTEGKIGWTVPLSVRIKRIPGLDKINGEKYLSDLILSLSAVIVMWIIVCLFLESKGSNAPDGLVFTMTFALSYPLFLLISNGFHEKRKADLVRGMKEAVMTKKDTFFLNELIREQRYGKAKF